MIDLGVTEQSTLRILVYQALKQYPTHALLPMLEDRSSIVRTAVARELQIRGGHEVFEHAARLLTSRSVVAREISAFLLGQLGTPTLSYRAKTLPLLEQVLFSDQSPDVRAAAAAGLGHLGSIRSIEALVKAANDTDASVRLSVAAGLGQFSSDNKVTRTLERLTKDEDKDVREWALHSLKKS